MKKKQFAFAMVPALAVAIATGGAAQADLLYPAYGDFFGGGVPAGGNIVYDNRTNVLGFLLGLADNEFGDGVTLAGMDRVVTSIGLLIHANGDSGATADVTIRLYDGGDDPGGIDPGALLWQSDTFLNFAFADSLNQYDFAVPNILVGDTVTWTIEMNNVFQAEGEAVGPRFVSPPTIGSSQDYLWNHTGGVWALSVFGVGDDNNNFGAVINAIPTPGALALLGLAGLASRRRRRA